MAVSDRQLFLDEFYGRVLQAYHWVLPNMTETEWECRQSWKHAAAVWGLKRHVDGILPKSSQGPAQGPLEGPSKGPT